MSEHILLVGEDGLLLRTRALILADWQVTTALPHEAVDLMHAKAFDAVILGQMVPASKAAEIIGLVRELRPSPAVLLIRFPEDRERFDVETHTTDEHDDPGWLKERVAALLAERAAHGRDSQSG